MDDLISRKAAIELLGEPHPLDYNAIADIQKIIALPSVPAVPLDKLCEWLEGAEKEGLSCLECADLLRNKSFVAKWMEGLNG